MTNPPEDFIIDQVSWHWKSGSEPPQKTLVRFRAVVRFLQQKGLTRRTLLNETEDVTEHFSIRSSDLTDEGLQLMKRVYDRWLQRVDAGKVSPEDTTLFDGALAKLRSS